MIYLQLFLSFLQVGAFSFGGGYAAMPLIKQQVITAHHWLSVSEFTDLISISQMTPGPIALSYFCRYQDCRHSWRNMCHYRLCITFMHYCRYNQLFLSQISTYG